MKKILSILLVSFFLLVFAAGCSITPSVADATAYETEGQGITLSKCLKYTDWEAIEGSFLEILDLVYNDGYTVYDSSDLSLEILLNRHGEVVVERCIGFVANKMTGDGKILNPYDQHADYIRYSSIDEDSTVCDGTVFLSYMVYNPESNYTDDIIERYDFVLTRAWED